LLGKRAEQGLLGGMLAFPSYGWDGSACPDWIEDGSFAVTYQAQEQQLRHVFTHFTAAITLYEASADTVEPPEGYRWQACSPDNLPSLMAKCYHASRR
jgi:A/G-specific adenine glycosylase